MKPAHPVRSFVAAVLLLSSAQVARGQHATTSTSTPLHTGGSSTFEQMGTNWGFNWNGAVFNFGGPFGSQFGQPNANAGATFGFNVNANGFNGQFHFQAGQGSQQTFGSQSPSVTMVNGQPGFVADTSLTPFVIGVIPTVGGVPIIGSASPFGVPGFGIPGIGFPGTNVQLPTYSSFSVGTSVSVPDRGGALLGGLNGAADGAGGGQRGAAGVHALATIHDLPAMDAQILAAGGQGAKAAPPDPAVLAVQAARSSSAGRSAVSVAEAQRLHEVEQARGDADALAWFQRARDAEEQGKPGLAKIYYQMAARRSTGQLRQSALAKLEALNATAGSSGGRSGAVGLAGERVVGGLFLLMWGIVSPLYRPFCRPI